MTQDDVPEVSRVERRCFTNPWPTSAYRRELRAPEQNAYLVLREWPDAPANGDHGAGERDVGGPRTFSRRPLLAFARRAEAVVNAPPLIGFAGMWIMYDEAHITTIGIDPEYRGRGLGELLLGALFDEAVNRGAAWLTLEVRVSNEPAQSLYRKYGFTIHGTRRRYYSDDGEDAYVMWSRSLRDDAYLDQVRDLRAALMRRLGPGERREAIGARGPWAGGSGQERS
jgi:ribosomal-protein-alanine N-acetyltransferase